MAMKHKYLFVTLLLLILALTGFGFTKAYVGFSQQQGKEELLIVTSFYPVYVAVQNVAGDCENVVVQNLSEPQTGCLHDYQLTPQDMILLSQADIFVVNGGGMESFLLDIAEEYPDLTIIDAGAAIFRESDSHDHTDTEDESISHTEDSLDSTEHSHEDHSHGENAHAWMSCHHYTEQITAIRDGLMATDPAHKDSYKTQAAAYLAKVEKLWREASKLQTAAQGQNVILLHEAFEYLAEDYGFTVAAELNLDEERQISAGEIAHILDTIQAQKIKIIFAEDLYGKDIGDTIEKETDCKVYYLNTLTRGDGSADGWLNGMEENLRTLREALNG